MGYKEGQLGKTEMCSVSSWIFKVAKSHIAVITLVAMILRGKILIKLKAKSMLDNT